MARKARHLRFAVGVGPKSRKVAVDTFLGPFTPPLGGVAYFVGYQRIMPKKVPAPAPKA
jgi:hypothetical protein